MKHTDLFLYKMNKYKAIYDLLPHHIIADRNTLLQGYQYCRQFHISKKDSLCWIGKNILHTLPALRKGPSSTEKVKRFKCVLHPSGDQISKTRSLDKLSVSSVQYASLPLTVMYKFMHG
jgi:hypothetical protein